MQRNINLIINRNRLAILLLAISLCMLGGKHALALPQGDTESSDGELLYTRQIRPLLVKHCNACHGPEKQKGDIRLDTLDSKFLGASAETWHDVLNKVSIGEMPPEDSPPLKTDERRLLLDWIRNRLDLAARKRKGSTNRTVIRRLTRYEYNNTLRDLLGIDLDFARDLPPEPASADGFQNNGSSLGMSPAQLEYYLKAARRALAKVIVEGPAPKVHKHRFEKSSNVKRRNGEPEPGNRLVSNGRFIGKMLEFPREGEFVLRVKAGARVPEGMGVPRMQISIGLRADTKSPEKILATVDVANPENELQVYEFRGRIEEFPLPGHNPKFPGSNIIVTNVYDDGLSTPKRSKFKPIALTGEQKKRTGAAVKLNTPTLPLTKEQIRGNKQVSNFQKATAMLQRQLEELRLISPDHKNRTDIAYRLFDIISAIDKEPKAIEELAKKHLKLEPAEFLKSYQTVNEEKLAGRQQVLDRFAKITPINRKTGKRVGDELQKVARSTLVIDHMEFEGPVFQAWPPRTHTKVLPLSDAPERERARQSISAFMERAYRRPVTEQDLRPVLEFYEEIRPASESFEEAIRESLAMVLISPDFLYLIEPSRKPSRALTQFELASRISYFLWSSMPDERLLSLARKGELSDPNQLEQHVRSMIADSRSDQFVEHFTDQWLDLSGLDRIAINPEYYPTFDDRLKPMMRKETQAFFREVLKKDLSALNFIHSDFAMLNEPLAKHYGLKLGEAAPRGSEFVRVALKQGSRRGGLLTQGSFLMINSTGEDSHPIRRSVWLLDRLLDSPPAPPPPDVPELDSEQSDFASLPLKKQLEMHRTKEACNDCHRTIDPWGVAFESYDATGLYRDSVIRKVNRKSIRSSVDDHAELPNGTQVDGVRGLKEYLLKNEHERFSRAIVSKLLSYAIGRSLNLEDRSAIEALSNDFKKSGYRLSDLIVAITKSKTFQTK